MWNAEKGYMAMPFRVADTARVSYSEERAQTQNVAARSLVEATLENLLPTTLRANARFHDLGSPSARAIDCWLGFDRIDRDVGRIHFRGCRIQSRSNRAQRWPNPAQIWPKRAQA